MIISAVCKRTGKILEILRERKRVSVRDLMKATNSTKRRINEVLSVLEGARIIERNKDAITLIGKVDEHLPDGFVIKGDWVSALVLPDGKTVVVKGQNMKIRMEAKE